MKPQNHTIFMQNKNYTGALANSLRQRIAREDSEEEFIDKEQLPFGFIFGTDIDEHLNQLVPFAIDEHEAIEAGRIAVRTMVFEYMGKCFNQLGFLLQRCESPIESIMMGALLALASKQNWNIDLPIRDFIGISRSIGLNHGLHLADHLCTTTLSISPQVQIGDYRVDILLELEYFQRQEIDANVQLFFDQEAATSPENYTYHQKITKLIVECDGHEFHEKTKKQAARDKRRDRALQSLGYKVFRFTGTEISGNALACAEEVLMALI